MAQVKRVTKAQKDQGKCEKCGTALPVGSPYVHFKVGFRSRVKRVRCTAIACWPRPSELTYSKMSSAYAAQEAANDTLDAAETLEDMIQALDDCATAAEEVAGEYEDTISETPMLEDQLRDKVDALEQWASDLQGHGDMEGVDPEDALCDEHHGESDPMAAIQDCEECGNAWEDLLEQARDAARDLVGSLEA